MRAIASLLPLLALLGCAEEVSEPGFVARPDERAEATEPAAEAEPAADRPWYTIRLPEGSARAREVEDVIDAVYVVGPVSLTVLEPIGRQRALEPWAHTVRGLFSDEPVIDEERSSVGSVPALVQVTRDSLRWVFVADGFGGIVKCWSTEPREPEWLHERCDPLIAEMSLVRPIHD